MSHYRTSDATLVIDPCSSCSKLQQVAGACGDCTALILENPEVLV